VVPRRRFRGLVRTHGWRVATVRHFPEVAADMMAAATGGASSSSSSSSSSGPSAAEWRAAYKLLTLVPWTAVCGGPNDAADKLAPMRVCVRLLLRCAARGGVPACRVGSKFVAPTCMRRVQRASLAPPRAV
jgi:hypothetical protein